jgi:hypothetical protein
VPIFFELFNQSFVTGQLTETRSVMDNSVVAAVNDRSNHGDHLPLDPAQIGATTHEVGIQVIMGLERLHIKTMYFEYIVDYSSWLHIFFIQIL